MGHRRKPCPLCAKGRPCHWHRTGVRPVLLKDLVKLKGIQIDHNVYRNGQAIQAAPRARRGRKP